MISKENNELKITETKEVVQTFSLDKIRGNILFAQRDLQASQARLDHWLELESQAEGLGIKTSAEVKADEIAAAEAAVAEPVE